MSIVEELAVDQLKTAHDVYVTTAQILSQRIQFFAEEFESITAIVNFHKDMAKKLRVKIEEMEPKKDEDGEKPKE